MPAVLHALGSHGVCIAAGGAGVAALVSLALLGKVSPTLLTVAFLVVFASYRVDYLAERLERRRLLNIGLTVAAFGVAFLLAWRISPPAAVFSGVFPFATFLYTQGIKGVPLLKAFYTSACWGGLVVLGMLFFRAPDVNTAAWLFAFTFLRMFVNSIACDFKDIAADRHRGTLTFPIWLGEQRTLALLHAVNLAAAALVAYVVAAGAAPAAFLWLCLSAAWPAAYLAVIKRRRVDLRAFSATVVDVEFLFWIPLLAIASL